MGWFEGLRLIKTLSFLTLLVPEIQHVAIDSDAEWQAPPRRDGILTWDRSRA